LGSRDSARAAEALEREFEAEARQRRHLEKLVFGPSVENKSILEIGSSFGHLCLEALKRGAATATGIESSPYQIACAREIARSRELPAEYICSDFEDWPADNPLYDIVLCVNVLHHLYDPVGALRKMMRLTRERLILEIPEVTWREVLRTPRLWPVFGLLRAPLLLMGRSRLSESAADKTFLFTRAAVSKIFGVHSNAFEPIQFLRSPTGGLIVEARRRQIEHLVVVAGVAGVGKSKFIERLVHSPEMRARFGIGDEAIEVVSAHRARDLPRELPGTVIFHYDILRPHGRNLWSHSRDPAFQLIGCGRRLTVITLVQEPGVLLHRAMSNEASSERRRVLGAHYSDPTFLSVWHDAWFTSIDQFAQRGAASRVVVANDAYTECGREEASVLINRLPG
jgi:SAM-dependent methyltransferase